ncbi:DNA polymerase-3 subunit gamma/tau [Parabacteroides sp. PF5-5]|uniref:DNA polymerase III subunit gamma/tau n=1 Tax=unclassified Parabacteroides TaxID=2649774 RepID=UPI0024760BFE|nr:MULTISPECIES: DNA polymerase III subunit gamma/tau [unclassified Parabacteroides]MDH6305160.1 DNA polymerase-3 subunit gamma/tau [Parabacteroides sp. PH5-39]MDH6316510.1 DNA polymerase-3 subunit gamma/tau [Parabacteroides sp. PF5-13]MDH6320020.1 DNA polymerase-3 subunit gamma/tau [Parabacteroides sp. PH5-13]MDH6323747.1 DNA polymerase-3 subunit gamma/tau [Parabacteroides sp. PH5-8]MDH6327697.1 DNA polymerase-3 subunit gamma/tau [Parabacteroides sp. PH5-41]
MDNYIVSARKYRPSTFRNVVGQKSLTTTLKNAIANNKLAHAYLFCGPRGVGKTSCARIFAKTINCLQPTAEGEACNACESCIAFNEQRSYNIHELDAASNNSVDDIRTLIDQVRIPPALGKYKVFIIDEVHMLSAAAFNAFLKTLEEPPHHALFILATTEKHKVLPTILSRCQIYDFSRISISDMVEHLEYVASQEGATAEAEALNVIAQKADGGMRDALSIFDQVLSFTNGNITYQAVIDNLNVLDYEYYFRLTDAMLTGNVREAILILNEILSKGFDGQNIITGLASHFRDLLICRDEATLVLFEVGASIRERYKETAKRCPEQFLYKAIELANSCDLNYRISRNKRLLLELTLIQLCQLSKSQSDDSKKKRLIEPVDGVSPQNQTQNQAQTPPPAQNAVVTTQMPASASVAPPPPSQPYTPGFSKKNVAQGPVSTSIKKIEEEINKPQNQSIASDTEKEQTTPFDNEALKNAWNGYAEALEGNAYLKGIMDNCTPDLQEDFHFEIAIHNPGQRDELLNNSIHILTHLRSQLKNSRVQMRIRMLETNEKKLAYTSADKYEHLSAVNPLLNKLKDEFNLMPD